MKRIVLTIIVLIGFTSVKAQAQEPYVDKGFAILLSTKDYNEALRTVQKASKQLGIEVNLRDYEAYSEPGLKSIYVELGDDDWDYNEYVPRGRWDDGVYLSIEYTDYFEGFTEGYYIVVLASGLVNEILYNAVEDAFSFYPDVYIKKASVYLGCMH